MYVKLKNEKEIEIYKETGNYSKSLSSKRALRLGFYPFIESENKKGKNDFKYVKEKNKIVKVWI